MGNSSSAEITNSIENRNINLSTIESINKNTSEIITNTVVSNHTSAQSGTTQVADVTIGKISAIGKDSVIDNVQILIDQNAEVQFNSNDKSIQNNNIMVDYALKLTQQLQNSISNDQAAKLASDAKASQENGFLSTAMGNSVRSDVNNQIKNINENTNLTKILNQITSTIQQNSETLTFKECIMSNLQTGRFKVGEITAQDGGKIQNVTLGIKQSIQVIQNCVFETLQKSDITTKIAQDFGFTVTNDTKNTQKGDSTATSTSTQKNIGVPIFASLISIVLCLVLVTLIILLPKLLKSNVVSTVKEASKMIPQNVNRN
jgi:hypothetical protein